MRETDAEHSDSEQSLARAPEPPAPTTHSGLVGQTLGLQRSAGNRATAKWVLLQRKKDPIDVAIAAKDWAKAADLMVGLSQAELEAKIKKLKPAQREGVMQGARSIDRELWAGSVIDAMEKIDPKSAAIGSLRYAKATGVIVAAGEWFKALAVNDARKLAEQLGFSRAQLTEIIGDDATLKDLFKDVWAYVPMDERMLYVMTLLVETHGYPVDAAAGIVGNLAGESKIIPSRIEGSASFTPTRSKGFDGKVHDWTDDEIKDRSKKDKKGPELPGVGIAQWTPKERREPFFNRSQGTDILYDLDGQVEYLVEELTTKFKAQDKVFRKATTTVQKAADLFLERVEAPKDPEQSRSSRRGSAARAASLYKAAHPTAPAP